VSEFGLIAESDVHIPDNSTLITVSPIFSPPQPPQEQPQILDRETSPGRLECPYCFLDPCITTYRQRWLGDGQDARAGNNLLRKTIYKKYWKLIGDFGGWNDVRYIDKKQTSMANEADVIIQREIMPECVLKLVRGLYPNLDGIPYMGHMWN
jgi:hypothetical protein